MVETSRAGSSALADFLQMTGNQLERQHSAGHPEAERQVPGMHRCAEPREPFQNVPIWPFSSSFRHTPPVHKAMQRKAEDRTFNASSKQSLKRSMNLHSTNQQTTSQIQAIATNRENDPAIQQESGCSLTRKAVGSGSECATRRS